jgi:hypothetical protein
MKITTLTMQQLSERMWNPIASPALELFEGLCHEIRWPDAARPKTHAVIEALIDYFEHDGEVHSGLTDMYDGALEDARTGRIEAELENFERDADAAELARQQKAQPAKESPSE